MENNYKTWRNYKSSCWKTTQVPKSPKTWGKMISEHHRWALQSSLFSPWSISYILNNSPAQAESSFHQVSENRGDKIGIQDCQGSSKESKTMETQKSQITECNILHFILPWGIYQFPNYVQWESEKPIGEY